MSFKLWGRYTSARTLKVILALAELGIEYQFIIKRKDNPLHSAPFWPVRQWPFLLLCLVLASVGVGWSIFAVSPFPLLFVFYSFFFLFQFWFFYSTATGSQSRTSRSKHRKTSRGPAR